MDPRKWLGAASLIGVAPEWLVITSNVASDMGGFARTLAKSARKLGSLHVFESGFTFDGLLRILIAESLMAAIRQHHQTSHTGTGRSSVWYPADVSDVQHLEIQGAFHPCRAPRVG